MKATEFYASLQLGQRLPALGIVAFSLCSINSVASLFLSRAHNPTPILWVAAGLVEIVTAWIVYQVVENARKVTKSNISKQDRRFYAGVLAAFTILAIPPLSLSVTANALEFGDLGLGVIFPLLSVACAAGSALPQTVIKHERAKDREKSDRDKDKAKRDRDKAKAIREQSEAEQRESERRQKVDSLSSNARQILVSLSSDGPQTQSELAQRLSVTPQTVSYHVKRLTGLGLVGSNGHGVEALVDVGGNGAHQ